MKKGMFFLALIFLVWGADAQSVRFDFGAGRVPRGYLKVLPETLFTQERGYGIDLGTPVETNKTIGKQALTDGYLTDDQPFYFSVRLPEGNYDVTVGLGDDQGTADMTVRAENRRLLINRVRAGQGQHQTVRFTVNIRDSLIAGASKKLRLKQREHQYLHWDNKLTLEFNGPQPKVNFIEITPNHKAISVFLAGNSTVVDGASEPFSAWGQMFPYFFQAGKVAIVNLAESGETLSGFIAAGRFAKMLSLMKPGDYAFVEFGHNDQKQRGAGVGAFTSYTKNLEYFIDAVSEKGGIPVLVTSVQRRRFENGKIVETLGDYPDAVRKTARERKLALIDLNAMSKILFETMGERTSMDAFVHVPAGVYPGQDQPIADNTHFRPYGAFEVSKLMVAGLRQTGLGLSQWLKPDLPTYAPTQPGRVQDFYWPESPGRSATRPDGN